MEKSSFFNSVINGNKPDRVYLAEDFARYFNSFIGNGVFPNPSTSLQVMANDDMTVTLKAGKGWINGYFYVNTDDLVIPIEMADGLRHRIDRIVLRLDLNNRWVKAVVKKGKLDTNPIPPELQRGDNIYELGLAEIRVGKGDISIGQSQIKDTRASSELCGWVHGVVDQVDTETLFKQYEGWYKKTTGQAEIDLSNLKEQFEKDLIKFTEEYTSWFSTFTGESEKEFNDWFDTIKNVLDDNVASKLLQAVEDLKITKADKSYVDEKISDIDFTELEKEIDKKADKDYVDGELILKADVWDLIDKADKSYVDDKISNIDINQFEAIDKGGYSFNNLKEPGVYKLWNFSTSPCGTTDDYITVVFKYNNKITQVAHSSTTNSSRENRVYTRYYTGSRWTNWRELTNVEVEKEIDSLKQSGVESNRILVDALNSKGVSASTSSTIKTNVNKVKDIKVGDYSVGDVIDITKLKPMWDDNPTGLWEFAGHSDWVRAVAVDKDGYVYSGSDDNKVMKISPSGSKVWEFTGHSNWVNAVAVDDSGYVYSGGRDNRVMKISPSGSKVWEFTGHSNYVRAVAVDDSGYVYSGGYDRKVMKISPGNLISYKIIA